MENVILSVKKTNVVLFGDGTSNTIITGSLNRAENQSLKTFETATFSVRGKGFIARDIQFRNSAGSEKQQAVAFHSQSSESVLFRCTFDGYQDTLYAHSGEQFYRECDIFGTVDFIFGAASAVFQRCNIWPLKPLGKEIDTVTAQSATDHIVKSGFAIINSSIVPYKGENFTVYLGRPWRAFATVVVMKSILGEFVNPSGWLAWNSEPPPSTLTYGEFRNSGPGSDVSNRIKWKGYSPSMSKEEAQKYTVGSLINVNGWLIDTCVPFDSGI